MVHAGGRPKKQDKIIALDPGGTTGWAMLIPTASTPTILVGQIGPHEHHKDLWKFLTKEEPDVIVNEAFVYQKRDRVNLMSREYIGVAKLYHQLTGTPFLQWTASEGKFFWTDKKLEQLGLLSRPLDKFAHQNDATRHLLYYVTHKRKDHTFIMKLKRRQNEQGE